MELKYNKSTNEYSGTYLKFEEDSKEVYTIVNKNKELLGHLVKTRVGAWMSFCLFLEEDCYLSASCQDEVREMTKKLNGGKS